MTTSITCLMLLLSPALSPVSRGDAVQSSVVFYSQSATARTLAYRRAHGLVVPGDIDGYIAVPDCKRIGDLVWLKVGKHSPVKLLVFDCSQPRDKARHERAGQVEVSWGVAKRLGIVSRGRVRGVTWRAE